LLFRYNFSDIEYIKYVGSLEKINLDLYMMKQVKINLFINK